MKKNLMLVLAILFAAKINAQVGFESHPLNPETYDNGSSGSGDFMFDMITFSNYYDTSWFYWTGFSISNVTDTVTSGFGNQYASYTGGGNFGSNNFAVYYPEGTISIGGGGVITGFFITNTTYAAIAMRDGDAFSKQFGSPLDANGNPDGTNGADYFRVWIICEDQSGTQKDSIEFYLADYQFTNNAQDYIVDTWEFIDLSLMPLGVTTVSFRFESSDVGAWGINTPTYFAIDDIQYVLPLGIAENEGKSIDAYPNPFNDELIINAVGEIKILDVAGRVVMETYGEGSKLSLDTSELPAGAYTILIANSDGVSSTRVLK